MLPCPASTLFNSYICIAKQNLKQNHFCKKLAGVIVILNRDSSIDKHTKKKPKYLPVPAVARVVPKKQLKQRQLLSYKHQPYLLLFQPRGAQFRKSPVKKTGLDGASTVGMLGYWTSPVSRSGGSEESLAECFPLHPLSSQL